MGWNPLKKISKTVSGIAKNPTNWKNYANLGLQTVTGGQVDMDGVNGMDGGFSDLLLGKKAKDIKPDDVSKVIRASQVKGLGELNSALDAVNPEAAVNNQVATEKKGILTSAQDARRNAQQMMARTGMKNSSLGLATNRSIDMNAGKDVASLNASIPSRITDQRIKNASTRIGVGNVNQNGINHNTIQGQRSGGVMGIAAALAPLAGQAFGAYKDYQTGQLAARS